MNDSLAGPGVLTTDQVGEHTISRSFELTSRQIMAYAASIKDANPLFFDDLRPGGLIAHPFNAFTFQWNTRFTPQIAANPRATPFNVHATTDLIMHRPFRQGDLITSQGKVISMEQIKPGVLQVTRYTMKDSSGDTVAELDMGGIIRGATLKGDSIVLEKTRNTPDVALAATPLWEASVHITADASQIYTECANIYNPIHTERVAARAAGLPDIILHGSATQAISATEIINRCLDGDASRVKRYFGRLRAMVLVDSQLQIRCHAQRENEMGTEIFFDVLNAERQPAVANGYMLAS